MIKLILFILLAVAWASNQEEVAYEPSDTLQANELYSPLWRIQNYQTQQPKEKPCARNDRKGDQPWIPSFASRDTQPSYEVSSPQPQIIGNIADSKIIHISQIDNPISGSRRSYEGFRPGKTANNKNIDENLLQDPTKADTEITALQIIGDCIKEKQKNKVMDTLLGSRRFNTDLLESAENNFKTDDQLILGNPDRSMRKEDNDFETERRQSSDVFTGSNIEDNTFDQTISVNSVQMTSSVGNSLQNLRICYACSTTTNPSCWVPDKRTTIKYCTREQSCVAKTFGAAKSLTIIRDCANSCEDSVIPGLQTKYRSCDLCHSDYCNSAISINQYSSAIILVMCVAQYTWQ